MHSSDSAVSIGEWTYGQAGDGAAAAPSYERQGRIKDKKETTKDKKKNKPGRSHEIYAPIAQRLKSGVTTIECQCELCPAMGLNVAFLLAAVTLDSAMSAHHRSVWRFE